MKAGPPNPSEPLPRESMPREIVEWARKTFDEGEFLALVRETEAAGRGLRLEAWVADIEATVRGS